MNTMKRTIMVCTAVLIAAGLLQSCKKTVTAKKLDGEWQVSEGKITSTWSMTEDGITISETETRTFDGSTLEITYEDNGETVTVSSPMTIDLTFDKKTGEYTKVTVMTDNDYAFPSYITFYEKDSIGNYFWAGYCYRSTKRVSTETESGFFTISGDAGDEIEKNSQIVFQANSTEEDYTDTYTYESATTGEEVDPAGKYSYDGSAYLALETSDSGTETSTGVSSYAEVWNVTDSKKDEMSIEYTDETNTSDDGTSNSSSTTTEWTITQK